MKINFDQHSWQDQLALILNVVGFIFAGKYMGWGWAVIGLVWGLVFTFHESDNAK